MKSKRLLITICVLLFLTASVLGTVAYLTDYESVTNTFTVGMVDIELDEAKVNPDGTPVLDDAGEPADRVTENTYHLLPGRTYTKDPTMTVKSGSEEAYIRMLVTVTKLSELDAIFEPTGADLKTIFNGFDEEKWIYAGETEDEEANSITYEFRYFEPVSGGEEDTKLEPLFDSITVPGVITGEQLQTISDMTITVVGHAIQAVGFEAETTPEMTPEEVAQAEQAAVDAAWAAFDAQIEQTA